MERREFLIGTLGLGGLGTGGLRARRPRCDDGGGARDGGHEPRPGWR